MYAKHRDGCDFFFVSLFERAAGYSFHFHHKNCYNNNNNNSKKAYIQLFEHAK